MTYCALWRMQAADKRTRVQFPPPPPKSRRLLKLLQFIVQYEGYGLSKASVYRLMAGYLEVFFLISNNWSSPTENP